MITIIQRVTQAQVSIANKQVGSIEQGILALVAIEKLDSEKSAQRLFERIVNYRIFPDVENRVSGIISSEITKIMAPAAKPMAKGSSGEKIDTMVMPNKPPTGMMALESLLG
jgi:D-tyrosyl-tRNA(Tyr) deacylase